MLAPSAAQASSKLVNEKSLLGDKAQCPVISANAVPARRVDTSRLILGGAPSALDNIRSEQQGRPAATPPPSAPFKAVTAGLAVFPAQTAMEPAGGGARYFGPPAGAGCGSIAAFPIQPAPEYDAAAELGTRAIPVKRTRFDDRWDRVRRAAPAGLMQVQLRRANASQGLNERELLARVNQWVNREVAYVNDDRNYSQRDFWATAEQTIARGSGDCEDFAILKMQLLRAAGISADRMKLVLLRDLAANSDHAFLLVQTAQGKVVLDNMTDRLYDGSQPNSVRPVLSFSENRRWVHAYRGSQPSSNIAAIPASQKSFALALNDQRSVNAVPLTFKTGFSK